MTVTTPFKQGANFDHLLRVIRRETTDGPVPILEVMTDGSIMEEVTGLDSPVDALTELNIWQNYASTAEEANAKWFQFLELNVAFSRVIGYDSAYTAIGLPIPRPGQEWASEAGAEQARPWQDEHGGTIVDRESFERSVWGTVDDINFDSLDHTAGLLPPGMQMHFTYLGIFEDLRALMGFEQMAIKSIDEPQLLDDILEKLTEIGEAAIDRAAAHPATGFIAYLDDLGFNTSTMMSPTFYREYLIPRYKRMADACHQHNKPFIFHSCGKVNTVMEDLIEVVGIDGFHSFQDNIVPVETVYQKYGDRISILGGVDVDLLARGSQEQVRARCRQILDTCGPGGGFALGSGNSVTNYCKIENYYAMIDEARVWNQEKGYL